MQWVCPKGHFCACVCECGQAFKGLCNCLEINSAFHSWCCSLHPHNYTLAHKQHTHITHTHTAVQMLLMKRSANIENILRVVEGHKVRVKLPVEGLKVVEMKQRSKKKKKTQFIKCPRRSWPWIQVQLWTHKKLLKKYVFTATKECFFEGEPTTSNIPTIVTVSFPPSQKLNKQQD